MRLNLPLSQITACKGVVRHRTFGLPQTPFVQTATSKKPDLIQVWDIPIDKHVNFYIPRIIATDQTQNADRDPVHPDVLTVAATTDGARLVCLKTHLRGCQHL
jgi:hypothetical protein